MAATPIPTPMPALAPVERPPPDEEAVLVAGGVDEVAEGVEEEVEDAVEEVVVDVLLGLIDVCVPLTPTKTPCFAAQQAWPSAP